MLPYKKTILSLFPQPLILNNRYTQTAATNVTPTYLVRHANADSIPIAAIGLNHEALKSFVVKSM